MKSKKGLMRRLFTTVLCIFGVFFCSNVNAQSPQAGQVVNTQASQPSVEYMAHVQNIGWMDWVRDGAIAGTTGKSLQMEALKINVKNLPPNAHITYQAHVAGLAWMDWVRDGAIAGTTGRGLRIEAIKIKLENCPGWSVAYQVHGPAFPSGWSNWVSDGAIAGTTGQGRKIEAIRVKIQQIGSGSGSSTTPGASSGSTSGPLPASQGSSSQSGSTGSSSSQSGSPVYGSPTTGTPATGTTSTGTPANTYRVACAPKITINTQIDDAWVKKNFGAGASSANLNQVEIFVSGSYIGKDGFVSCQYKSGKGEILNLVYMFPCKNALSSASTPAASPNAYYCTK
jgi:hypothetical protein